MLHELTHRTNAGLRSVVSLALLLAFVLCSMPSAFAQTTTGNIQGTVTASQGNTKLAGVVVTAVAPSGRYTGTTDQNGFFNINGVSPDTYTITYTTKGYETYSLTGVTVVQGQTASVSAALNKSLTTIGRTQARSTTGAFQPTQTTDQYNVGVQGITTTLGKTGASSESNLLASIPGASFDSSGYPVLRGGREYEEGFQYEGIDYTDAFTHQFTNSLLLNGAANFQVQPGAGDASVGNAGTGAINIVSKRGTNPGFGQFELGAFSGRYEHDLRGEYGWASPNGRFSNYSSYYRDNVVPTYGPQGVYPLLNNCFFNCTSFEWDQDLLNNFVYKFGKDNSAVDPVLLPRTRRCTRTSAPASGPRGCRSKTTIRSRSTASTTSATGLSLAQIQAIYPFTLGQTALDAALRRAAIDPPKLQLQPARGDVQAPVLEQLELDHLHHDEVLPRERGGAVRYPERR